MYWKSYNSGICGRSYSIIKCFIVSKVKKKHAICPGDRVHEFIMKLNGATYVDIHKMGGGIGFTVNNVK